MAQRPWWRIGWRNLGRNRRRTLLTASGLALGFFGVVLMGGLSLGFVAQMISNGTGVVTGQIQLHAPDYLPDRRLWATLGGEAGTDLPHVLDAVTADPDVRAAAPRVYAAGLVSAGTATEGAMFMGIDPALEPKVSRLAEAMVNGRLPAADGNALAVGAELAKQLGVAVGDTLVVVAPAADGSMGNDLFTVSGIFNTGLAELDAGFTLAALGPLQRLLALTPNRVHEIAARVDDPWIAPAVARRLNAELGHGGGIEAEAWTTLRPEMVDYANLVNSSQWLILVIVFVMAIFGVANTMLMAAFERRREFALLLALGASPKGIAGSIASEALALSGLSLVGGLAITMPVLFWWHRAPPDLTSLVGSFTMSGALIRPVLLVEYPWALIVQSAVALAVTALAAALYPTLRAVRVPPAETLAGR